MKLTPDAELAKVMVHEAKLRRAEPADMAAACCMVLASMIHKQRQEEGDDPLAAIIAAIVGYLEIIEKGEE